MSRTCGVGPPSRRGLVRRTAGAPPPTQWSSQATQLHHDNQWYDPVIEQVALVPCCIAFGDVGLRWWAAGPAAAGTPAGRMLAVGWRPQLRVGEVNRTAQGAPPRRRHGHSPRQPPCCRCPPCCGQLQVVLERAAQQGAGGVASRVFQNRGPQGACARVPPGLDHLVQGNKVVQFKGTCRCPVVT